MKRSRLWVGVLACFCIGAVVGSCSDSESPTAPNAEVAAVPDDAADVAEDVAALDLPATLNTTQPLQVLNCMGDEALNFGGILPVNAEPSDLNCTAGDVVVAETEVSGCIGCGGDVVNGFTCSEGDDITLTVTADLQSSSQAARSDIGIWIATDGDPGDGGSQPKDDPSGAETGECQHFYFDPAGTAGELADLDGSPDTCGDIGAQVLFPDVPLDQPVTGLPLVCVDADGDEQLDAGSCIGWKVPGAANVICPDDVNGNSTPGDLQDYVWGTLPANSAKCECSRISFPITVLRSATVKVIKDVTPVDDGSTWTLTIASPSLTSPVTADVGDNGFIEADIEWAVADEINDVNDATVTEAFATGAGSAFYTSSYSCTSTNPAHNVASTSGRSIPTFTDLLNQESIVCTFTNTRIPPPDMSVDKTVVEKFDRDWDWTIEKSADQGGEPPLGGDVVINDLGQTIDANYSVKITGDLTDSNFRVSGVITVSAAASTATAVARRSMRGRLRIVVVSGKTAIPQ